MKKNITLISLLALSFIAYAVIPSDVYGVVEGVTILPATQEQCVNIGISNLQLRGTSLGQVVFTNVPLAADGSLQQDATLHYCPSLNRRVEMSIMQGSSLLSNDGIQMTLLLSLNLGSDLELVTITGTSTLGNYTIPNGDFEGTWDANNEPANWHSFESGTGTYISAAKGGNQLQPSNDAHSGSYSALIRSREVFSVVANGNMTNGQINAGSMSAANESGNYAFSQPNNSGYVTPMVGYPDSIVFWTKFIPAGDAQAQASMHSVVTTNARYQDPENSVDYSSIKVAEASRYFTQTDWVRQAVAYTYPATTNAQPAYILTTFTTNKTPGQGASGDEVYVDDVQLVYNHSLTALSVSGKSVNLSSSTAQVDWAYSDLFTYAPTTDAHGANVFCFADSANRQILAYVVANDYAATPSHYSLYSIQLTGTQQPLDTTIQDTIIIPQEPDTIIDPIGYPYNTMMTEALFNQSKIHQVEDIAWTSNGVRCGESSTGIFTAPAYNWDDKSFDIQLYSGLRPKSVSFDIACNSSIATGEEWYVAASSDNASYYVVWTSNKEGTSWESVTVDLDTSVHYIRFCYTGNFAGYFRNIQVENYRNLEASATSLDFGIMPIGQRQTRSLNILYDDVKASVSTTAASPWCSLSTTSVGRRGRYGSACINVSMTGMAAGEHTESLLIQGDNGQLFLVEAKATITQYDQTLTWETQDTLLTRDTIASAVASSGLPVQYTFTPEGIVTYDHAAFHILQPGIVTIQARQDGNAIYAPAEPIERTLTIFPAVTYDTIQASICPDDSLLWHSAWRGVGQYEYDTLNCYGGDSIITLYVTALPSQSLTLTPISVRLGETYIWKNQEYMATQVGSYMLIDSLTNQFGCDSVLQCALQIQDTLHTDTTHMDTIAPIHVDPYAGEFMGNVNVGGESDVAGLVDIFPSAIEGEYIFVLPDFQFMGMELGDIVVPSVRISSLGQLSVSQLPLYMRDPLDIRVHIDITDDPTSGNYSRIEDDSLSVFLQIDVPDLAVIPVLFTGVRPSRCTQLYNGGMEGVWDSVYAQQARGVEPQHWNSLLSGTGDIIDMAACHQQIFPFTPRPGSTGTKSALITSTMILGARANGTMTTGRVNASSVNLTDGSQNYNYTDLSDARYHQPLQAQPDSVVAWVRYVPADGDVTNVANTANMSAIVHTQGYYQEPQANCSATRIAEARQDIQGNEANEWQRLSVPFVYDQTPDNENNYLLFTFTTCVQPGGGTSSVNHQDSLMVDDVTLIYNSSIASMSVNGHTAQFQQDKGYLPNVYCDSCYEVETTISGRGAKSYVGYQSQDSTMIVVVKGHDFVANPTNFHRYTIFHGSTPDTIVPPINPDTIEPINPDTIVPPVNPDTIVPINPDTIVPINPDTIIPINPDTIVPINPDTIVPIQPDTTPDHPAGTEFSAVYQGTWTYNTTSIPMTIEVFGRGRGGQYMVVARDFDYQQIPLVVMPNLLVSGDGQCYVTNYPIYVQGQVQRHIHLSITSTDSQRSSFHDSQLDLYGTIDNQAFHFMGTKLEGGYYQPRNPGMEGEWDAVSLKSGSTTISGVEPQHWNSFITGSGKYIAAAANNHQLTLGAPRPGSAGTQSAVITSNITMGVKANGNLTNGRLNGGAMTATDGSNNYNYTDLSDDHFNQPFAGEPDSMIVWLRYVPADGNVDSVDNTATMSAVIHTDDYWKEPSDTTCIATKIGEARQDIRGAANHPWQRFSLPFTYETNQVSDDNKYMLITFTTCATPGGGTTYKEKVNSKNVFHYDSLFIDDIEMVYNSELEQISIDQQNITLSNGIGVTPLAVSDSSLSTEMQLNSTSAVAYVGWDAYSQVVEIVTRGHDFVSNTSNYHWYRIGTAGQIPQEQTDGWYTPQWTISTSNVQKLIRHGLLMILRNGKIYNAQGVVVE